MQRGLGDNDFADDPRFPMEWSATRNPRPARALSRQHLHGAVVRCADGLGQGLSDEPRRPCHSVRLGDAQPSLNRGWSSCCAFSPRRAAVIQRSCATTERRYSACCEITSENAEAVEPCIWETTPFLICVHMHRARSRCIESQPGCPGETLVRADPQPAASGQDSRRIGRNSDR
jgi:hypothetical protein